MVEEFLKKLIIINVVCEPVHRVYSEFLHVTAKVIVKPLFPPLEGQRMSKIHFRQKFGKYIWTVKARRGTIQYKCEISRPGFNFVSFQKFNFWWNRSRIYSRYQQITFRNGDPRSTCFMDRSLWVPGAVLFQKPKQWPTVDPCSESKIRDLFEKGKDFNIPKYQKRFGERLVIIDGNNFVTNPGEELRKIEQKFSDKESWFLEPDRFRKRDDGHYEGIKFFYSLIPRRRNHFLIINQCFLFGLCLSLKFW